MSQTSCRVLIGLLVPSLYLTTYHPTSRRSVEELLGLTTDFVFTDETDAGGLTSGSPRVETRRVESGPVKDIHSFTVDNESFQSNELIKFRESRRGLRRGRTLTCTSCLSHLFSGRRVPGTSEIVRRRECLGGGSGDPHDGSPVDVSPLPLRRHEDLLSQKGQGTSGSVVVPLEKFVDVDEDPPPMDCLRETPPGPF